MRTMTSVPVPVTTSDRSRWCPTPEQVMLLEGMYRGGLKTPTATQIQQIVSRLSVYGKIQGKNVFYWFQNHKARDRQKLQKKLTALYQQHRLYPPTQHHPFLPLHPVGGVEDVSNSIPSEHQPCKLMCDCPLMTMMLMEHHGTTPYTTRVPPKTLQLFPLTNTDLKQDDDDDQHSTSSKP